MRADLLRAAQGRPVYAEPVQLDEHGATRVIRQGPGARPGAGRNGGGQRRKSNAWAVWGLIGLAAAAVIALVIGLVASTGAGKKTVPNLADQTKDQAVLLLKSNGLREELESRSDPSCDLNQVLEQSPAAGTRVDENSLVHVVWCAGAGEVTIPLSVIGKTEADAKADLEALLFTVTSQPEDSSAPQGTVVKTDPEAGKPAAGRSPVTIFISKGNLKKVPNLLTLGEQSAKDLLQQQGFTAPPDVRRTPVTNEAQRGKVINQDPVQDTEWDPTRPVTIVIGIAPQTTTTTTTTEPAPSDSASP
jgi:serine/threonine-protein kinase